METRSYGSIFVTTLFALAIPVSGTAAPEDHHYKLIDLGTLGGPQSFGDAGHGAANINNKGIAAGVADTATLDPNYPNFGLQGIFSLDGTLDPYVHHTFLARDGSVTDLGALPGADNSSSPGWVTENGLVAGQSLTGTIDPLTGWRAQHAVIWKDGKIIDLGTLGGYESGVLIGMGQANSKGQVTGFATNAIPDPVSVIYFLINGFTSGTQTRAFLWDESNGMRDLGTLGGPDAWGFFINERGQIAGAADTNATINPVTMNVTVHPFLWDHGTMTDLGTLGGTFGLPGGLNNRGQVVGESNLPGDMSSHVFLWNAGAPMRDLGSALGGSQSSPSDINDAGDFVGQGLTAGDEKFHAFIRKNGTYTDLGRLPDLDDTCVGAFGINARDQVVGQVVENFCTGPRAHAFIWQDGRMTDLNVFVPVGSDLTLVEVERINNRGELFGIATLPSGDFHAFLLIPCKPGGEGCVDWTSASDRKAAESPVQTRTAEQLLQARTAMLHRLRSGWTARYSGPSAEPPK
jgi:probable HAF family extracellular repeat protein